MPSKPRIQRIYGVDFSGGTQAGRNIWIATCSIDKADRLKLDDLNRLEDLADTPDREPALAHFVGLIRASNAALWGIDFPFGLPIELGWRDWRCQLDEVANWKTHAKDFGAECVRRCVAATGAMHVKRQTDIQTRTPFDCHHYRIIYQTFHGMRDVLLPLIDEAKTCILPYQFDKLGIASRIVAEACPSSTLKRLKLPHTRYKQPQGELEEKHRATRRAILAGLREWVAMEPKHVRVLNANPGGDALDAVIAAVGVWNAWSAMEVREVSEHPRYRFEGLVFC